MLSLVLFSILGLALTSTSFARPWEPSFPSATVYVDAEPAVEGTSPVPTGRANKADTLLELFKREQTNTCGYINAQSTRSVTCVGAGDICATNALNGVFGCCPSANLAGCYIKTDCVPNASLGSCGSACRADPYVTKCDVAAPYCQEDVYVFSATRMTYFGCATMARIISVWPMYTDGIGSVTQSAVSYVQVTSASTGTAGSAAASNLGSASTELVTQVVTDAGAGAEHTTVTVNNGAGAAGTAGTGAEQTQSPQSESPQPASSAPVGAIAGGAVGGVAVLCAFAFGIFFLLTRNKRNQRNGPRAETVAAAGGPAPSDPKPPMGSSMPAGAATEYYSSGNTMSGGGAPMSEKTAAVTAVQQGYDYGHAPTGAPVFAPPQQQNNYSAYAPPTADLGAPPTQMQMQQAPESSLPSSPAPPYASPVQEQRGGSAMLDGTQLWAGRAGVYEVQG